MSLLRLLSVSAFASICVMQAVAQLPAAPKLTQPATPFSSTPFYSPQYTLPKTFTFVGPKLFKSSPPLTAQQTAPPSPSDLEKAKAGLEKAMAALAAGKAKILTAANEGCFTMRSYGFTAGDFQSGAPKPSTSTTCTPARGVTLKDATTTAK